MTSFTRKLFNRDPAAAEAYQRHSEFERAREIELRYGKNVTLAQFTPAHHKIERTFGKRKAMPGRFACAELCGHPACSNGCVGR